MILPWVCEMKNGGTVKEKNNLKKTNTGICLLLPFFTLLAPYKIGLISASLLLLFIIALFYCVQVKFSIRWTRIHSSYCAFLIWVFFKDILRALSANVPMASINRMVEYIFCFFIIFIIMDIEVDELLLYRCWKIAGLIYIFGLLYHIFCLYVIRKPISPLTIIPGYSLRDSELLEGMNRPTSFFSEPAAFAWAMIPLEFLSLRRRDIKWAIISTLSILASTSTIGIVLSFVLWGFCFYKNKMPRKVKLLLLVSAVAVLIAFVKLPYFENSFSKLISVIERKNTFGSRVRVGYEVVESLSLGQKCFGTLSTSVMDYVGRNLSLFIDKPTTIVYFQDKRIFLNAFSQLIFFYGIIGAVLYVVPIVVLISQKKYKAKPLLMAWLLAIMAETMVLDAYHYLFIVLSAIYVKISKTY